MPTTRTRRRRTREPEFSPAQLAFLAGKDDWPTDAGLMEVNRFCWLTSHCRDPDAKLSDGSPGPNELRQLARAAGLPVVER
jgi:hypothetical protein